MSDESSVSIKHLPQHLELVTSVLEDCGMDIESDWGISNSTGLQESYVGWCSVDIDELTASLADAGIPCDVVWENDDYREQEHVAYVRFTEDGVEHTTIYYSDRYISVKEVSRLLTELTFPEFKARIDKHLNALQEPSWENQEELGKKYAFIKSLEK